MSAGVEVTKAVTPVVNDYIKSTYPGVVSVNVMDIDHDMGGYSNYAGYVVFEDGAVFGFDYAIKYDGTFASVPSNRTGHVDLWDMKTRQVVSVPETV